MIKKRSGTRMYRKSLQSMEKYHDEAVNRIYEKPEELGENAPDPEMLVLKLKEPELPGLIAKKKKDSLVDLLFLYKFSDYYEILLVEVKIGQHRMEEGIYKLDRGKNYFKNNWQEWFSQKEVREKIDFSRDYQVWFSNMLLIEKPLNEIKDWMVSKRRFRLGKILSGSFV